jgi:hypothetical protein
MMTEAGASPTVDAEADLDSFDADGFTLDWVAADATARELFVLALGDIDSGADWTDSNSDLAKLNEELVKEYEVPADLLVDPDYINS